MISHFRSWKLSSKGTYNPLGRCRTPKGLTADNGSTLSCMGVCNQEHNHGTKILTCYTDLAYIELTH